VANPAETTTYTLSYLYGTDCQGTGQITVRKTNTAVVIPNIFSPDGDGRNDVFFIPLPEGVTGTVKEMSIYDRWGNNVFVAENVPANDPAEGWKGSFSGNQAVPGVYVYRVVLQLSGKANTEVFAGSVTLMK
jgi:gliding motility-associated-like protein